MSLLQFFCKIKCQRKLFGFIVTVSTVVKCLGSDMYNRTKIFSMVLYQTKLNRVTTKDYEPKKTVYQIKTATLFFRSTRDPLTRHGKIHYRVLFQHTCIMHSIELILISGLWTHHHQRVVKHSPSAAQLHLPGLHEAESIPLLLRVESHAQSNIIHSYRLL